MAKSAKDRNRAKRIRAKMRKGESVAKEDRDWLHNEYGDGAKGKAKKPKLALVKGGKSDGDDKPATRQKDEPDLTEGQKKKLDEDAGRVIAQTAMAWLSAESRLDNVRKVQNTAIKELRAQLKNVIEGSVTEVFGGDWERKGKAICVAWQELQEAEAERSVKATEASTKLREIRAKLENEVRYAKQLKLFAD